jgi:hypothetical protein
MGIYSISCPSCGKGYMWFSGNPDQRCWECKSVVVSGTTIPPETLRLAEEAVKRVFTGDVVAAGVDFILNCPLGEDSEDQTPAPLHKPDSV